MPAPYVHTVRDQILYEFAVAMSRLAFDKLEHSYVYDRYKLLRDGRLSPAAVVEQWEGAHQLPRQCAFCGSQAMLLREGLIPRSRGGSDSPFNTVLICQPCHEARGDKGLFEWLGLIKKNMVHPTIIGKYLLQLFDAHQTAGSLDVSREEIEGFCHACPLPGICEEWAAEGQLTCFCLESVLPLRTGGGDATV